MSQCDSSSYKKSPRKVQKKAARPSCSTHCPVVADHAMPGMESRRHVWKKVQFHAIEIEFLKKASQYSRHTESTRLETRDCHQAFRFHENNKWCFRGSLDKWRPHTSNVSRIEKEFLNPGDRSFIHNEHENAAVHICMQNNIATD